MALATISTGRNSRVCISIAARSSRMTVITVYEGRPSEGDEKKIIINKTTAGKKWISANL